MAKAIVFDLDGTLLNSLPDIADSMNQALLDAGLPTHPLDAYRYFVGDGVSTLAKRATGDRAELLEQVLMAYRRYYGQNCRVKTRPYDGIPEMLKELMRLGLPLCVFSNKPHEDTLEVMRWYFPDVPFAVLRGQMEGVPVKPDPAGALQVAREIAVAPADFLYVGDTGTDMACARAAGMHPVGVTWGFRPREELQEYGAADIIDHPSELVELAKRMK